MTDTDTGRGRDTRQDGVIVDRDTQPSLGDRMSEIDSAFRELMRFDHLVRDAASSLTLDESGNGSFAWGDMRIAVEKGWITTAGFLTSSMMGVLDDGDSFHITEIGGHRIEEVDPDLIQLYYRAEHGKYNFFRQGDLERAGHALREYKLYWLARHLSSCKERVEELDTAEAGTIIDKIAEYEDVLSTYLDETALPDAPDLSSTEPTVFEKSATPKEIVDLYNRQIGKRITQQYEERQEQCTPTTIITPEIVKRINDLCAHDNRMDVAFREVVIGKVMRYAATRLGTGERTDEYGRPWTSYVKQPATVSEILEYLRTGESQGPLTDLSVDVADYTIDEKGRLVVSDDLTVGQLMQVLQHHDAITIMRGGISNVSRTQNHKTRRIYTDLTNKLVAEAREICRAVYGEPYLPHYVLTQGNRSLVR